MTNIVKKLSDTLKMERYRYETIRIQPILNRKFYKIKKIEPAWLKKDAFFDTRAFFFHKNPKLRQNVEIEGDMVSSVLYPWKNKYKIYNMKELEVNVISQLKLVLSDDGYRALVDKFRENYLIEDAFANDPDIFYKHRLCMDNKISTFKKMGKDVYQDLYERIKVFTMTLGVEHIQEQITKYYVTKIPKVRKSSINMSIMHNPIKIDFSILSVLNLCPVAIKIRGRLQYCGIAPVTKVENIEPWMDLYQALVDGTSPRDLSNLSTRLRQKEELGEEMYNMLMYSLYRRSSSVIIEFKKEEECSPQP